LAVFKATRLRQLDFQTFAQQAVQLGYAAVDIPVDEPDAAERSRALVELGHRFSGLPPPHKGVPG